MGIKNQIVRLKKKDLKKEVNWTNWTCKKNI